MQAKDQVKVLAFGFTIIRKEIREVSPGVMYRAIKAKTKNRPEWHVLAKDFETNAKLERRMTDLLRNPLIIED